MEEGTAAAEPLSVKERRASANETLLRFSLLATYAMANNISTTRARLKLMRIVSGFDEQSTERIREDAEPSDCLEPEYTES